MDYGKLDASLAMAVDAEGRDPDTRELDVSVRLAGPLSDAQRQQLRAFGIGGEDAGRTVLTGTVSRQDVESLAGQPWVVSLTLSAQRRPM
ncbi:MULTISPECIES: hypothetical protein [unclassified Streptomyces]|uniref:hypothetical protein n=1 Tax=unclassified Streptomyces TaxID=2593676 RepID=UPI002E120800|nr:MULTISPECIES: hypothetical protein [unclassified Streptomyces]WSR23010.1 hypothetical protein OG573_30375 [Streptomyces sp. NBC_01205]